MLQCGRLVGHSLEIQHLQMSIVQTFTKPRIGQKGWQIFGSIASSRFWKCPSECKTKFNTRFSQVMLFEVKIACNNHIWSTMVGKWVVNERNRDFPSFFKGQICTFANETEIFHKGYFGRSVLDFIFPWFCPVFVPRWFWVTRQEFINNWFTAIKVLFWRIGNGNHQ